MTKSIIEIAREAGCCITSFLNETDVEFTVPQLEAFATAIKAAHLEELAGVKMPEPVAYIAWRDGKPCYEGDDAVCEDAVWPVDSDDDRESKAVVTLDQCQQAVATAVARKEIEFRTDLQEVVSGAEQTETKFEAEFAKKDAEIAELQSKYFVAAATELEKTQSLTAERDRLKEALELALAHGSFEQGSGVIHNIRAALGTTP